MKIQTLCIVALLAFSTRTAAQESPPRLVLQGLEGKTRILFFEGLSLTDPREEGAWSIRTEGFAHRPENAGAGRKVQVTLHGGEELRGRLAGGKGEVLWIELLGGVRLPLSVDLIRSILLPEHLSDRLLAPLDAPSEGDRLYRRTEADLDAVDGTLEAFSKEGVRFESIEVGLKTFPWKDLAALFIESLGDEGGGQTEARVPVVVDLADRSRLRGALRRMSATHCELAVGGHELALPWDVVAEVTVADGRYQFLSDFRPVSEEGRGVPFGDDLGMSWPHRMDANAFDGGVLRSNGKTWRRGIGMHAPSRLSFALDGQSGELVGFCAIDDEALKNPQRARGAVIFRLHLDGEVAWESGIVRGGDKPVALPRLKLGGKKELVLEADSAGSHAGDRANWLRMVLVR